MAQDTRINAYDTIKAIAIFLVVFYHVGKLNVDFLTSPDPEVYLHYFLYGFSSIGVPLFFMVNGALLLNKEKYELKKHIIKTITILVLLLVWGSITLLFFRRLYKEPFTLAQFIQDLLQLKTGRIDYLWFLKALIYLYILFPFVKALYDHNRHLAFYMMLVVFVFTFSHIPYIDWINPFDSYYSYALVYFMLGAFLANHAGDERIKVIHVHALFLTSALALFFWGIYQTIQTHKIYDVVWQGYDMVFTLAMAAAVFVWCKRTTVNNSLVSCLRKIGAYTLGIYFVHFLLNAALNIVFPLENNNLVEAIGYSTLVLFLSFALTVLGKNMPLIKKLFTF